MCFMYLGPPFASKIDPKTLQNESRSKNDKKVTFCHFWTPEQTPGRIQNDLLLEPKITPKSKKAMKKNDSFSASFFSQILSFLSFLRVVLEAKVVPNLSQTAKSSKSKKHQKPLVFLCFWEVWAPPGRPKPTPKRVKIRRAACSTRRVKSLAIYTYKNALACCFLML